MFKNYENNNFHLDLWESCDNGTACIRKDIPEWSDLPESIIKTLKLMNRNIFLGESFEYEGKIYDNFEDVFHIGSYVESIKDIKHLAKILTPENIKKKYPNDKSYPVDFFAQFVDPDTLKRVGLMIVYQSNPYELGKYDKKVGRIIVYKAKAFAAVRSGGSWKFGFMINNKSDIVKARDNENLRISWNFEPRKIIYDLSPRAIQNNVSAVVSILRDYIVVGEDDFESVIEDILDGTR